MLLVRNFPKIYHKRKSLVGMAMDLLYAFTTGCAYGCYIDIDLWLGQEEMQKWH